MTDYCEACSAFGWCDRCGTTCKHWPCSCDAEDEPQERHEQTHKRAVALDKQVGGEHYKSKGIQPVEYILANSIGFCEGSAIKYLTRWKDKGGIEDLKKAKHFIEILIDAQKLPN